MEIEKYISKNDFNGALKDCLKQIKIILVYYYPML